MNVEKLTQADMELARAVAQQMVEVLNRSGVSPSVGIQAITIVMAGAATMDVADKEEAGRVINYMSDMAKGLIRLSPREPRH